MDNNGAVQHDDVGAYNNDVLVDNNKLNGNDNSNDNDSHPYMIMKVIMIRIYVSPNSARRASLPLHEISLVSVR